MDPLFSVLLINLAVTLAWLGGLFLVVRQYHRMRLERLEHDRDFEAQEAERCRAHHAKLERERHVVLERMFHVAMPILLETLRMIDKPAGGGIHNSTGGGIDDAPYTTAQCCDGVAS